MFFLLMLSGIFFLVVSILALGALVFLLFMVFSTGEDLHLIPLVMILGLIVIGLWNMIDAGRMMGKVEPRILVMIFIRSVIALIPVALVLLFLDR
tara:strand:- start:2133 stop:2417 length:285 start_codon:yes stop_codon:yes gene_type:complete